ncbi:putative glutamine amidotransferase [Ananas comosus]|uniref:Putative glutamine amidotransferase n=1 Tax=Ananas comosus TaxID=4615 RepID=A0A199UEC0_ANACO|nr:putative glutamine amidotransferase [Ananas comosus]
MREKRFAVLLAARDSDYVKKVHGGYFDVFVAAFGDGGERWDYFRVVDGEFPAFNKLDAYDGFVLSGSPHDAYGNERWILKLCLLLQTLFALKKRVLGVCFGHQLLCRALGGRVGRAIGGWEIGVKRVNFVENLGKKFKFFGDLDVVPLEGEIMAYSENTNVEMFAIGEHILGIQGHPEYTKDILLNLIDRLINTNTIDRGFGDEAKKRVDAAEPDRKFWLKICKGFLKGAR